MIKYSTSFRPTLNGFLHLGHWYCMKINEEEAHQTGGKFGIIIDYQQYWEWTEGKANMEYYRKEMMLDLAWMGIEVDYVTSITELYPQIQDLLFKFSYQPEQERFVHDEVPEVIGIDSGWYPYTEEITCHKVIADFLMGVNWRISGWDLLGECNHYTSFTHKFRLPRVRQTFIPKLKFKGDTVSKTEGKFKIRDFREKGVNAKEVLERLAIDCMIPYREGWLIDNIITPYPKLGNWVKEYGF